MGIGWKCPECSRCYAPWKAKCDSCGPGYYETTGPTIPSQPIIGPNTAQPWVQPYSPTIGPPYIYW